MNQEFRSVLAALRQGSPVVLDVPADVRYHLLHRYADVSVRNGRLALASFALMLFGIAYEAPLVPRLLALLAMAAIIAVRSRLSAALLQRMDPDDPQPDGLHELLVLAAMVMWNAAPFALESVVSPPNLAVVIYASLISLTVLAVSYVAALPASMLATLFSAASLIAFMLHQGTVVSCVMALGTAMLAFALQSRLRDCHRTLLQALAAERENAALVRELEGFRRTLETESAALGSSLRDASVGASRDPLTGLFNRRHLIAFAQPLAALVREQHEAVTVCVIDLDHFKRINDHHGHPIGDAVLRAVAELLGTRLRDGDCLSRYGGEEFVVVLRRCDVNRGRRVAEALRHNIASAEIDSDDGVVPVTVSVGIAQWGVGEDFDDVIQRADRALCGAKRAGRDRVEVDARDAMNLLLTSADSTLTGPLH